MDNLKEQACKACHAGTARITDEEAKQLKPQIPEWEIIKEDGIQKLQRIFAFSNFIDALNFTHKVGLTAEYENHHPRLITEWGKVTVLWWTHKIKGLHQNDFIMASKTDDLI